MVAARGQGGSLGCTCRLQPYILTISILTTAPQRVNRIVNRVHLFKIDLCTLYAFKCTCILIYLCVLSFKLSF